MQILEPKKTVGFGFVNPKKPKNPNKTQFFLRAYFYTNNIIFKNFEKSKFSEKYSFFKKEISSF